MASRADTGRPPHFACAPAALAWSRAAGSVTHSQARGRQAGTEAGIAVLSLSCGASSAAGHAPCWICISFDVQGLRFPGDRVDWITHGYFQSWAGAGLRGAGGLPCGRVGCGAVSRLCPALSSLDLRDVRHCVMGLELWPLHSPASRGGRDTRELQQGRNNLPLLCGAFFPFLFFSEPSKCLCPQHCEQMLGSSSYHRWCFLPSRWVLKRTRHVCVRSAWGLLHVPCIPAPGLSFWFKLRCFLFFWGWLLQPAVSRAPGRESSANCTSRWSLCAEALQLQHIPSTGAAVPRLCAAHSPLPAGVFQNPPPTQAVPAFPFQCPSPFHHGLSTYFISLWVFLLQKRWSIKRAKAGGLSFSLLCLIVTCPKPFNSGCWRFIHLQLNVHPPAKPGKCQAGKLLCSACAIRSQNGNPSAMPWPAGSSLWGPKGRTAAVPGNPKGKNPVSQHV